MQRDMDLVRAILLAVEAKSSSEGVWSKDFPVPGDYESDLVRTHIITMASAGFFAFEATRSTTNPDRLIDVLVFDLSWKGHEFLDTIRDPEIWRRTKGGVKKIGSASFDVVIDIAKSIARGVLQNAGIPLP